MDGWTGCLPRPSKRDLLSLVSASLLYVCLKSPDNSLAAEASPCSTPGSSHSVAFVLSAGPGQKRDEGGGERG